MGITLSPEAKIARKVLESHNIVEPSNIESLALKYAQVLYHEIPIKNVDGISLNLKIPNKKPVIIVNSYCNNTRKKFTLAHELGHVIIPWHFGTIVDNIDPTSAYSQFQYQTLEQQANTFAAEILMPFSWMEQLIAKITDLAELHHIITIQAGVSAQAAAIRILNFMPINVFYVATENNIVVHSGKSPESYLFLPDQGAKFDKDSISYIDSYTVNSQKSLVYHWYRLNNKIKINTHSDPRTWREILETIISDIYPFQEHKRIKQSINGVLSNANDILIRNKGNYDISSLTSACIFRMKRKEFNAFCCHKDFELFIRKRVEDFLIKRRI